MLEFLRKHQYGLMLVVAILTIIAFVFLYDANNYNQGGGAPKKGTAFKVYGKGYDSSTLRKMDGYFELAQQLGFFELAGSLRGTKMAENGSLPLDFPINLMILRKKGREMGISPSDSDVKEELERIRAFAGPDGKFSPENYSTALERLARNGFQKTDLRQITSDKVTLDKVKEMLAANVVAPTTEIDDRYAATNQEITAYALKRSLEDFEKNITISDEEIAERYEENKESLMSEEQRKIEFIRFEAPTFPAPVPPVRPAPPTPIDGTSLINPTAQPAIPSIISTPAVTPTPTPKPEVEAPTPAGDAAPDEGEAEAAEEGDSCAPDDEPAVEDEVVEAAEEVKEVVADATEGTGEAAAEVSEKVGAAVEAAKTSPEAVVDALKKEMAAPAATTPTPGAAAPIEPAMTQVEKDKITKEFKILVKTTIDSIDTEGTVDFKALGEDYMAKAKGQLYTGEQGTTELFDRSDAPNWLKNARASGRAISALERVFALKEGELSDPEKLVTAGREDWVLFRVLEIVEPKPLTLEQAKEDIVKQLKEEKADEQLKAALKKDADAIKAEMAGTKSFKESADKLEIEYARHYKYVGQPNPDELRATSFMGYKSLIDETVAGTFSDVLMAGDKGYLVYVASKELVADEAADNKKMTIADQLADPRYGYGASLFREWLELAYKEAEPERRM